MRFDSHEHLKAWRATGAFPKIHENIANVVMTEVTGRRMLDLGCSYGLLGARLVKFGAADVVVGVDVNLDVLTAAAEAGVPILQNHLKIEKATFAQTLAIVKAHRINVVIGRRIMPELFGADQSAGEIFGELLRRAGVKEMVLEGRIATAKATNSLSSIDREVAMLRMSYLEKRRAGAVSYLVAR